MPAIFALTGYLFTAPQERHVITIPVVRACNRIFALCPGTSASPQPLQTYIFDALGILTLVLDDILRARFTYRRDSFSSVKAICLA